VHGSHSPELLQVNPEASATGAIGTALCLISNAKALAEECDEVVNQTIAHMLEVAHTLIVAAVGDEGEALEEEATA